MTKRDRLCACILSGAIGLVLPIVIDGAATLHAQQNGGTRALLAMGQCIGAFKPTKQATPQDGNSGALKMTFSPAGDGFEVKMEWATGVGAYNNPRIAGLAFPKSFTFKKTSINGTSLGMTDNSGKSVFNFVFEGGARPRVYGDYTIAIDPGVPYTMTDCTR